MAKPILNPTAVHVVTPPALGQDYHAVVHGDSGREVVRCASAAEAIREQTRLNKLGK